MNNKNKQWHLLNAENQILGRLSVTVVHILTGKGKPNFVRNIDLGDYVVILNASKIKVSGQKENKKIYFHHTGYPQGLRSQKYIEIKNKDPRKIIIHAVKGMLPNNRLKASWLKRLYVYPEGEHPFSDKFK